MPMQGECAKCEDRGDQHGVQCIVRTLIFDRDFKGRTAAHVTRSEAIDAAVRAIEEHTNKQRGSMSQLPSIKNEATSAVSLAQKFGFTDSQLDLVKRTVAKNATNDELELFFYRCKELQLNPLMPGQVYFLKFKKRNPRPGEDPFNPGTIIVGIDGFRARAQRTGQLSGIKRGVIRNDKGECIGGWADVFRKDWTQPAHEEVPLQEYRDPYKDLWRDMPETMIKKVAEVAALRMAFPEELGGIYSSEEMDQAQRGQSSVRDVESDSPRKPSEAQLKRLFAIAKQCKCSHEHLKAFMLSRFKRESSKDLILSEYDQLCDNLESGAVDQFIEMELKPQAAVVIEAEVVSQPGQVLEPEPEQPKPAAVKKEPELPWDKYLDDPRMVK